jgi:hypothetical protein
MECFMALRCLSACQNTLDYANDSLVYIPSPGNRIMNQFLSADFIKFTLPLLGAVVAWFVNQWQQRSRDEYLRKEKLYRDLLDALRAFYESPSNAAPSSSTLSLTITQTVQKRQEFLNQLTLAWLYTPDAVIEQAYAFLDTVHANRKPLTTDQEKEVALGNVIAAIRRDLFRPRLMLWQRTKLSGADFRHLRPN